MSLPIALVHSHDNDDDSIELIASKLPKVRSRFRCGFIQYQGFWFKANIVPNVIRFQRNFRADKHDIILASKPKSGTTWLKALLFSVVNRGKYKIDKSHPLLASNPHKLVSSFEFEFYSDRVDAPRLSHVESPRLLSTHMPYEVWPESMRVSECPVVYVCRNPLDTFISNWHFVSGQGDSVVDPTWSMEDDVDGFCRGEEPFGPFWDHVLGFWRASLERPEKIMFLKYEDLKEDAEGIVKRLAEFVGFPFSDEERKGGVARQICELCSLKSLKDIQAEKKPKDVAPHLKNEIFFRKGEVGDWVNELSPQMVERLEKVIHEKMKGSGLVFRTS